jgi:cytochrome c553
MRRVALMLVGAAGALLGLLALALSGLPNVAATVQPFALTEWLWHVGVRQSVTLRSLGTTVPPLDGPARIRRAAGHYELVCATCHGSPVRPPAAFARHLLPRPPPLTHQMEHWRPPARIFWTVKHGIRHSAMPGWPDQRRDDEVWDMVAFLRAMPDMSEATYRGLSGHGVADTCARCHGADGEGRGGGLPRLDIQSPAYLAASLRAFRDGSRASGTMQTAVAGLDEAAIAGLASRFGQGPSAPPVGTDGPEIALRGIPERKIAACESCHGAGARADYPRLAGQDAEYLARQLGLFVRLGAARGGRHAEIMARAVGGLSDAEIAVLAAWYAALPPFSAAPSATVEQPVP